jgi:hypothetical protein
MAAADHHVPHCVTMQLVDEARVQGGQERALACRASLLSACSSLVDTSTSCPGCEAVLQRWVSQHCDSTDSSSPQDSTVAGPGKTCSAQDVEDDDGVNDENGKDKVPVGKATSPPPEPVVFAVTCPVLSRSLHRAHAATLARNQSLAVTELGSKWILYTDPERGPFHENSMHSSLSSSKSTGPGGKPLSATFVYPG